MMLCLCLRRCEDNRSYPLEYTCKYYNFVIWLNVETAYTTYSGGITKEKFVDYLDNILIPTLKDSDVIIMDNMHSHHVKEVAETVSKTNKNLTILYPPYSLDFNPIEMMWSKIKDILRNYG